MNVIIEINGEPVALSQRAASILYNQLCEALAWKTENPKQKKEKAEVTPDAYSLY